MARNHKNYEDQSLIREALNRLGKNSIIYGLGGALHKFIGLLMLPFFTEVLTKKDYGIAALIALIGIAMSGLLTLGTGNSLGIIYFKENNLNKRYAIIWSNIVLLAGNGIFWYAIIFFSAPFLSSLMFQTSDFSYLIRLAFITSVLTTIVNPLLNYLRMEEMAWKYLIITISFSLVTILSSVLLVLVFEMGVTGLILASAISASIKIPIVWTSVGRKLPYNFDSTLAWSLVRVGFPSIFGLIAFLVINYADRQMIERMLSLDDLGIYSVGYSFGMVIMIAMQAFATAWPPFFSSYINKPKEAQKIFGLVLSYYTLGFGFLVVFFFLAAYPVVSIMTAPAFHDCWIVVGLVAAGYALKGCYLIFLPSLYFAKKLKYQSMIEWIAAILNIALNCYLIDLCGIIGAAYATCLSYLSLPLFAWIFGRKYLLVDYEWSRVLFAGLLIFSTCFLLFQIPTHFSSDLLVGFFYGLITVVLFCLISFFLLLKAAERTFIKTFFSKA